MRFEKADLSDAAAIAAVRAAAADQLTTDFGHGHWSSRASEAGVRRDLQASTVIVARDRGQVVATLTLQRKKPWAIDPAYFTAVNSPIHLINMAVHPRRQRRGIGRALMAEAARIATELGADAIRLDAYDAAAGAGGFYRACGYAPRRRKVYRGVPLLYFERLIAR